MENQFEEDFMKLYVEYQDKREFIFIPAESEIFQLKMMICAKFRLYEYNKLTIINKGNIISNYDDRVRINEFLIPESDYTKEYELLVIYNSDSDPKSQGVSNNNSMIADKNLNESSNYIQNNYNNKNHINNINNLNTGSLEFGSNSILDPNSVMNKIPSSNNPSIANLNANLNSSHLNYENSLIKEKSFLNESNVKYFVICGCSEGNEALNICLKCNCFVCRKCIKQEPHLLHQSEIIKISKCSEHMKSFMNDQTQKLNDNFFNDENWIYLQNFENFFSDYQSKIERNYDNVMNLLEDMKASEIDYLVYLKEKIKIEEKLSELNSNIDGLIREFQNFDENEKNIQQHINFRKNVLKKYETIVSQHNILKQYYNCFTEGAEEIGNFNENVISKIEERLNVAEQLFNIENINKSLANLTLKEASKGISNPSNQVLLRLVDSSNIQTYRLLNGNLRIMAFEDKTNFKQNFNVHDYSQLNLDNKLFILTGKKHNQFYFYSYEKNEVFKLAETLGPHCGGSLIYISLTNSIYCLGGLNTKKCEIYRNDDILFSLSNHQSSKNLNNKWEMLPELGSFRQDFSSIVFNRFIYVFFGINSATKINNNSIERMSIVKNDVWEQINLNQNISVSQTLNSHANLIYNDREILLLGGSDGKNSKDSILVYNAGNNSVKVFNEKIPEFRKYMPFMFNRESQFLKLNCFDVNDTKLPNYANIDNLNRLHLVNTKRFEYQIINLNK